MPKDGAGPPPQGHVSPVAQNEQTKHSLWIGSLMFFTSFAATVVSPTHFEVATEVSWLDVAKYCTVFLYGYAMQPQWQQVIILCAKI